MAYPQARQDLPLITVIDHHARLVTATSVQNRAHHDSPHSDFIHHTRYQLGNQHAPCLAGKEPWRRIHCDSNPSADALRVSESFEAAHSNHGFSASLAQSLGITRAPLRIDSQAKYGAPCQRRLSGQADLA